VLILIRVPFSRVVCFLCVTFDIVYFEGCNGRLFEDIGCFCFCG
jgi:hypothetical protein